MVFVVDRQCIVISFPFIKEYSDLKIIKNVQIKEVMAKAKNHTDNIDSVTLGNIETNSAFVKRFSTHPISFNSTVIRKTVLAITLL